jgi:hypothetical protein
MVRRGSGVRVPASAWLKTRSSKRFLIVHELWGCFRRAPGGANTPPGRSASRLVGASAEAGLVEHRDERWAATVLLAKISDPGCKPLALAGRVGGAAGVLEDRDGSGVGAAASSMSPSASSASTSPPRSLRSRTPLPATRQSSHPGPNAAPTLHTPIEGPATAVRIAPARARQCESARLADDQTPVSSNASV